MLNTSLIGAVLISLTVIVHTFGLFSLSRLMTAITGTFHLEYSNARKTAAMIATVLGLFVVHGVEIWIWAVAYLTTNAVADLPNAIYLSMLTFSTLGVNDAQLDMAGRLLAGMEGLNGFILIGWSTAYLVSASQSDALAVRPGAGRRQSRADAG